MARSVGALLVEQANTMQAAQQQVVASIIEAAIGDDLAETADGVDGGTAFVATSLPARAQNHDGNETIARPERRRSFRGSAARRYAAGCHDIGETSPGSAAGKRRRARAVENHPGPRDRRSWVTAPLLPHRLRRLLSSSRGNSSGSGQCRGRVGRGAIASGDQGPRPGRGSRRSGSGQASTGGDSSGSISHPRRRRPNRAPRYGEAIRLHVTTTGANASLAAPRTLPPTVVQTARQPPGSTPDRSGCSGPPRQSAHNSSQTSCAPQQKEIARVEQQDARGEITRVVIGHQQPPCPYCSRRILPVRLLGKAAPFPVPIR